MSLFGLDFRKNKWETLMIFAVLSQSLWGLLQIMMMDVFNYDEDVANNLRVLLVATTMSYAIVYCANKAPRRFLLVYLATFSILLFTLVLFPENQKYLMLEAMKLTLPVVIPSFLCVTCVKDYDTIERILYVVSWFSVIVAMIYAVQLFSGRYIFSKYSISFSFTLLLPTLVLISHKTLLSYIAALFLFVLIVFLGSRSAAIVIVIYAYIEILFNKKNMVTVAIVSFVAVVSLPILIGYFEQYGVSSRTLSILQSEEGLVGHLSHRDEIYDLCISKIQQNPIMGIGLYGDRLFLGGSTSHNVILELLLDFGVFGGSGVILYLFFYFIHTFLKSSHSRKVYFMRYFLAVMIPLMVSGSYLKDYNLGLFLGICYLINKERKNQVI